MIIKDDYKKIDIRTYNKPVENDFAVLIPSVNNDLINNRDIIVQQKNNKLQRISQTHSLVDAMSYILFFCRGEPGWNINLKIEKGITLRDYMKYNLQIRKKSFNVLFKGKRLTHQYICNKYIDIETEDLNFIRFNQKKIRVEMYKGLVDAFNQKVNLKDIGKIYVLPSSFIGSPRYMHQLYQDAMAIVMKYGKPDLFITMTSNPLWPEITDNCFDGQTSWDRFDLINDVFKLKKDELIRDIKGNRRKNGIFGQIQSYVWVNEFQKRGLPHVHLLVILKNKINTSKIVDKIVSAEIPDKRKYPELFEKIIKFMIHRPCASNEKSICYRNGKCSKRFPKEAQDHTIITEDSFPIYRRRNKFKIKYKNFEIKDEYVVPYNPFLIMKYNCHINVEVCSSIKAVKYLYKYVYKGYDRSITAIKDFNEIDRYVENRYISSVEAHWKIKSYKTNDLYPNVVRIPVHLEDEQNYYYDTDKEDKNIQELMKDQNKTKLTEWLDYNAKNTDSHDLTYEQFAEKFVWYENDMKTGQKKIWKKSRYGNRKVVVRLCTVSPKDTERFYLRCILKFKKGAKSFEELRTVNKEIYGTFRKAANAMKIIDTDEFWFETIKEATDTVMPYQCRNVFSYLLVYGNISNPNDLWGSFKKNMYDDFKRKFANANDNYLENLALIEIQKILKENDLDLNKDFGLPQIKQINIIDNEFNILADDKKNFEKTKQLLTAEQIKIYDLIDEKLKKSEMKPIFIDAPGGSGKTFLINNIIIGFSLKGYKIVPVASSGIAATLLTNGRTAHSMFKIPLNIKETTVCNIKKNTQLAQFLKSVDVIIWDEAPMASKFMIETVNETLKDITNSNKLFGNKLVIFCGDFRQILPIVRFGRKEEIIKNCINQSFIWKKITTLKLTKNLRLNDDLFAEYLLKIGEGKISCTDKGNEIELEKSLIFESSNINDFIDSIFDPTKFYDGNLNYYKDRVILSLKNDKVDQINELILKKFKSKKEKTYYSTRKKNSDCEIDIEILNNLKQSGLPKHELNLKVGSIVILLRNLDLKNGLCNGTRILITNLLEHILIGKVLNGKKENETVVIPRIILNSDEENAIKFSVKQFPVKLAFCLTPNKAQGQSFEYLGIDLEEEIFAHGQLYVALSRCRHKKNIKILLKEENINNKVRNEVYREVLKKTN